VRFNLSGRNLDIAVKVVAALVVVALVYSGYAIWSTERAKRENSVPGRAIENLMQVVRDNPSDPGARVLLAQAFAAAGRINNAAEQFNAALTIDKKNAPALEGLGLIAMRREEWQKAQGYWRELIADLSEGKYANQDQRIERANYYLGLTLIELKQYEDAVGNFKEALRLKRDSADTHYALAMAYKALDSKKMQRKELETAVAFVPTYPEANYELGLLLLKDGDEAGAAELFRRSVDNAPGRAEPLEQLQKLGTAEDRLAKARALRSQDPEKALVQARIAIAIDSNNIEAARLVASLLEKLATKEEAMTAYERILQLAPNDSDATEAIKRLQK
jgi:Tfp pilus assembly protein PilF